MKNQFLLTIVILCSTTSLGLAQETYPINDVQDKRHLVYAVTNATVHITPDQAIENAVLFFKDGIITEVSSAKQLPKGVVEIDAEGKHVYPTFVDLHTSFGIKKVDEKKTARRGKLPQFVSKKKGPYGWNQAIIPERNAYEELQYTKKEAQQYQQQGIGTVLSHTKDGIARGSGALVLLSGEKENLSILKAIASSHFSFDKGKSTQDYPGSLMGSVALLRQTFLDAKWYQGNSPTTEEGINISLEAWNNSMNLPLIFDASNKWNCLRASEIAQENGILFILKGGGDEYQRLGDLKKTNAAFIIPVNYPDAYDVSDIEDNRFLSLAKLKHWEMASTNAKMLSKNNIPFCFTSDGLEKIDQFLPNIRKAVQSGLVHSEALRALTTNPARFINISNELGTLEIGKIASFFIADKPIFNEHASIESVYIKGKKQLIKNKEALAGKIYSIERKTISGKKEISSIVFKDDKKMQWIQGKDTTTASYTFENSTLQFSMTPQDEKNKVLSFSGRLSNDKKTFLGTGYQTDRGYFEWTANKKKEEVTQDFNHQKEETQKNAGNVLYPFSAYGSTTMPQQEKILIQNATLWTNTDEGVIERGDILIDQGKIVSIGKALVVGKNVRTIDATGKHVTPGIIDEHSHIAVTGGLNEYTQSSSAEVRIKDALNPEDINIFRQLGGGVTSSHILHGSSNPIGGQTQLIKLRWGGNIEQLLFKGWDPFIKFALGENVKQSNWGDNHKYRFPQTRMGVEQVMDDAFTRAKQYQQARKKSSTKTRKDLELEALSEILEKKRFITCHSYVQSEINMLMKVAEKYGFIVNTFTHILEGYKVAEKMKKHGAAASTFSDWWTYKMEVMDAIPYNASLLHKMGVTVAINSDDKEMARRLNQEAAKMIRYGKVGEEDALKSVTLNPAKMLHIDSRVGSLMKGKDADIVIWSDHPLSVYAKAEKTIIDGIIFFDRKMLGKAHQENEKEKQRIIQRLRKKKNTEKKKKPELTEEQKIHCEDVDVYHYSF